MGSFMRVCAWTMAGLYSSLMIWQAAGGHGAMALMDGAIFGLFVGLATLPRSAALRDRAQGGGGR